MKKDNELGYTLFGLSAFLIMIALILDFTKNDNAKILYLIASLFYGFWVMLTIFKVDSLLKDKEKRVASLEKELEELKKNS